MDISFIYTQKRREFGKPCNFTDVGPHLIVDISSEPKLKEQFFVEPTADKEVDCTPKMCAHEVNTDSCTTEDRGMNHTEGGWPAAVDIMDEDSTTRFRKKVEKDKVYINSVKALGGLLENLIMENKSLNVYEEYYGGEIIPTENETPFTIENVFNDINNAPRRIMDLSWSYDSSKIAAAYSDQGIKCSFGVMSFDSYVWDLQNNVTPLVVLCPEYALNCIEFSIREPHLILGGYRTGQVGVWDIRYGNTERSVSSVLTSHTHKVTGIKWLESGSNMTFVSTSVDGRAMSWDIRDLYRPVETVCLDPEKEDFPDLPKQYTISCLNYDPTVPDNFMLGTEQGHVLSLNRKCEFVRDSLKSTYPCSTGPIINIERNSYFPKIFGACDPWSISIWSESSKDSLLNIVSHSGHFTDFTWSQTRPSVLFLAKTSGFVEVWDVPGKLSLPMKAIRLDTKPLLCIRSDYSGARVACGSINGNIHLLGISDYLRESSNDERKLFSSIVVDDCDVEEGFPMCERLKPSGKESWAAPASIRKEKPMMFKDMFDPPETAEELFEENQRLYKDFPKIVEDEDNSELIKLHLVQVRMETNLERKMRQEQKDVSRTLEYVIRHVLKEEVQDKMEGESAFSEEVEGEGGVSKEVEVKGEVSEEGEGGLSEEVKEERVFSEEELYRINEDVEDTVDMMKDAIEDEVRDMPEVEKTLSFVLGSLEDGTVEKEEVDQTVGFVLDSLSKESRDGLNKEDMLKGEQNELEDEMSIPESLDETIDAEAETKTLDGDSDVSSIPESWTDIETDKEPTDDDSDAGNE